MRTIIGKPSTSIPSTLTFDDREYSNEFLAETFNQHFVTSCVSEAVYDSNVDIDHTNLSVSNDVIFLSRCAEVEIYSFLKSLSNNTSARYDDNKAQLIKAVASFLCMPLVHICNQALTTAIFPNAIKIPRVAALHRVVQ